jgi:hypothetical protein
MEEEDKTLGVLAEAGGEPARGPVVESEVGGQVVRVFAGALQHLEGLGLETHNPE